MTGLQGTGSSAAMTTVLQPHTESDFMGLAFRQAEAAATRDEVPIGAVLVDSMTGQVLAANHNGVEELHDPTAHAEMLVIRTVSTGRKEKRLPLCDLYVTLEPCPMCAGAVVQARLPMVVYGCTDPKAGACDTLYRIPTDARLNHRAQVVGGVLAEQCAAVLGEFFAAKRRLEARHPLGKPIPNRGRQSHEHGVPRSSDHRSRLHRLGAGGRRNGPTFDYRRVTSSAS